MPQQSFIQNHVNASGTTTTDLYYGSDPLYDVVTNTTSACTLRTRLLLGDLATPTNAGTTGSDDLMCNCDMAYRLDLYGLLSTAASPGNLTISVRVVSLYSSTAAVTLQTATITPDASLSNAGLQLSGIFIPEVQYPKSTSALMSFVGRGTYDGSAGYAKPITMIDSGTLQAGWGTVNVPASSVTVEVQVTWATASTSNIFFVRQMAWTPMIP